jgi:hypothetical protein
MKKIAFLILAFFVFFLNSCKDDAAVYEGDPYLHFNQGARGTAVVTAGTGSNTVDVEFGTIQALSGSAQVKLIVDTSVSTAVEGTDFQIVNQNLTVNAGQINGKFQVKLLEAGAVEAGKVIVFKLQSSSIPNATFDQTYTLTYKKACLFSVTPFSGTYKVVNDTWEDYSPGDLIPVQAVAGTTNQFKILASNNPYISNAATAYMLVTVADNGAITVASNQPFNYGGANVFAVSGTGTVNFCTGAIDITSLAFGSNAGNKFSLVKN